MNNYFFSKLSNINRRMALHQGDANRRLAYQANDILAQLHLIFVPEGYKKEFTKFISLIDATVVDAEGRTPIRIKGIQNKTAIKYIKLLREIEEHLRRNQNNQADSEEDRDGNQIVVRKALWCLMEKLPNPRTLA